MSVGADKDENECVAGLFVRHFNRQEGTATSKVEPAKLPSTVFVRNVDGRLVATQRLRQEDEAKLVFYEHL